MIIITALQVCFNTNISFFDERGLFVYTRAAQLVHFNEMKLPSQARVIVQVFCVFCRFSHVFQDLYAISPNILKICIVYWADFSFLCVQLLIFSKGRAMMGSDDPRDHLSEGKIEKTMRKR